MLPSSRRRSRRDMTLGQHTFRPAVCISHLTFVCIEMTLRADLDRRGPSVCIMSAPRYGAVCLRMSVDVSLAFAVLS